MEIAESAFVDNLIIYPKQANTNLWKTILQNRNMKINIHKTEIMKKRCKSRN